MLRVCGCHCKPDQNAAVGGVRFDGSVFKGGATFNVIFDRHLLNSDELFLEKLGQCGLGRRAWNHRNFFSCQIRHVAESRVGTNQETTAINECHEAEIYFFLTGKARRRRAALDIDFPLSTILIRFSVVTTTQFSLRFTSSCF